MIDRTSHPLDTLIDFAWASGADRFWVNNAKDELKKLRLEVEQTKEKTKEWVQEVYRSNEFAVEQTNELLQISKEIQTLKDSLTQPVAYAKIDDCGDLYDLNLQNNPYDDQTRIIPLYRICREE